MDVMVQVRRSYREQIVVEWRMKRHPLALTL
jgi:hypothetical protein